jgi:hypothetical protein
MTSVLRIVVSGGSMGLSGSIVSWGGGGDFPKRLEKGGSFMRRCS